MNKTNSTGQAVLTPDKERELKVALITVTSFFIKKMGGPDPAPKDFDMMYSLSVEELCEACAGGVAMSMMLDEM